MTALEEEELGYTEFDTSGIEDRLDTVLIKLDKLLELSNAFLTVAVEGKHWLMLLFFVVSITCGLWIGYVVGKRR